jgi:murein DD-endopeptidase MepM/ murein hydrolase activator NlpD
MISKLLNKLIRIAVVGGMLSLSVLDAQNARYFVTPSKDYHIVQKGDSIDDISAKYDIPAQTLRDYNHLESDRLIVGQKIYFTPPKSEKRSYYVTRVSIPRSGFHLVEEGQDLEWISLRYGVEALDLLEYNRLADLELKSGEKIWLESGHVEMPVMVAPEPVVTVRDPSEIRTPIPLCPRIDPNRKVTPEPVDTTIYVYGSGERTVYHVVKKGESLSKIVQQYGITVTELKQINGLRSNRLDVGQRLLIRRGVEPAMPAPVFASSAPTPIFRAPSDTSKTDPSIKVKSLNPVYHIVKRGETLTKIAGKYGTTSNTLRSLNGLRSTRLKTGQRLMIRKGDDTPPELLVKAPSGLAMPVNGKPVSEFGWRGRRPHKGIDLAAPKGEPIYAALDGKVVFVGRQRGYGNVIIIEHADSVMTVYGHNDTNLVRKDDAVLAGQPIATVGRTGNAKCPHLHFEYRVRGVAINPRLVLPLAEATVR